MTGIDSGQFERRQATLQGHLTLRALSSKELSD
jgi:hypothetical protein